MAGAVARHAPRSWYETFKLQLQSQFEHWLNRVLWHLSMQPPTSIVRKMRIERKYRINFCAQNPNWLVFITWTMVCTTKSTVIGSELRTHHNDYMFVRCFFFFFLQTLRDVCEPVPYRRFDSLNTYNRLHNLQADSDLKYGNGTNHSFGDISNVHLQLRSPTDLMPLFLWLFFSLFLKKKQYLSYLFSCYTNRKVLPFDLLS